MSRKYSNFIRHPLKLVFSWGMRGHLKFLNDRNYIKLMYWCKFGKKLKLDAPKTFNEKLQWLKIYDRKPELVGLVDKYKVKEYISEIIGEQYIIPTLGVWNNFKEINFNKLPNQFVLKCTHDSGGVVFCKDKSKFDFKIAKKIIEQSLRRNYYWIGREWPYKNVPPRIIAEPFMVDESGIELKDYKIFNFHGEPKIIQVDFDRFACHRRNLYDTNWNYIPAEILYPTDANVKIPKPECLDELLMLAKKLSKRFIHVRTDFYIINEKIYFGELTFLHGAGYEPFRPEKLGELMGEWLKLPIEDNYGT